MEEELRESLLFKGRDVIIIQYVENSMGNELLSKYPDNTSFDLDYSQSSIWSPLLLVPPYYSLSCLGSKPTKLEFDDDDGGNVLDKIHLSNVKRKICTFWLSLRSKFKKNKLVFKSSKFKSDASHHLSSPTPRKGWKKVLNMTRRKLKKKSEHRHRRHFHPISDVTLSEYFKSQSSC